MRKLIKKIMKAVMIYYWVHSKFNKSMMI